MSTAQRDTSSILVSERAFHDERYKDGDSRTAQLKYYWAVDDGAQKFGARVANFAQGSDVLEYGCGVSGEAERLEGTFRSLHGIDISEEGIRRLQESCRLPNVHYSVMDAMDLQFAARSFDLVFGRGIVHHLDIDLASREVSRVLRPGGRALFWEPLGLNPLINAYRWLTPKARTPDEHPLLPADFEIMRRHFSQVDVELYGLATIAAVPFRHMSKANVVRGALARFDKALFRLPGVRWLAWYAIVTCRK